MILVLSGKYQGEEAFAKGHFPEKSISIKNVDEYDFSIEDDIDKAATDMAGRVMKDNSDVILCHIVGCGVVPVDERQRYHAELVGRTSCLLAEKADEVWIVRAGIGQQIR